MSCIDRIGMRYGLLEVLERAGSEASNGTAKWKCLCECGNIVIVRETLIYSKKPA